VRTQASRGRLGGKRALISGTGGGIGRATALLCAHEGAHVVGCDLDPETSEETVRLVRAAGGRMDAIAPVDLASEASHVSGANIPVDGGAAVVG
jgi:meso-butanediol dehydrogenase / (S,S)-butanediol dehydrogenase / diacetyl reductase